MSSERRGLKLNVACVNSFIIVYRFMEGEHRLGASQPPLVDFNTENIFLFLLLLLLFNISKRYLSYFVQIDGWLLNFIKKKKHKEE